MNKYFTIAMISLGALLALGFVCGMNIISKGIVKYKQDNVIKVKGYAEEKIKSNLGTWSCELVIRHRDLKFGYPKVNYGMMEIKSFLVNNQVTEAEITECPVDISPVYRKNDKGNDTNDIDYYNFRQSIHVKSTDVAKIEKIARSVTALIEKNLEIRSEKPSYVNTEIDKIKLDLLGKATKNGYERAETLAKNSKGRTGKLVSASQGVFQITAADSTGVSDEGTYDTSTIEKSAKAVVTLEFTVE